MNETETSMLATIPIELSAVPQRKWEREYQAFRRMLPELLKTHRGKYVAFHEGQVVDVGEEKLAVALRALAKAGNVDIYVGQVTDGLERVYRSGVRREVSPAGGAA